MEVESLRLVGELETSENFPLAVPKVLYHGHLYDKEDPWLYQDVDNVRWYWPYCIQNFIPGRAIHELYPQMVLEQRIKVADYLGKALKTIHRVPIKKLKMSSEDPWYKFSTFLKEEHINFRKKQKELGIF